MPLFHVHVYREMRLKYNAIEADTPHAAAEIARDRLTSDAEAIDDCEGMTLSALVDLAGDEEYEHSVMIDFEEEMLRKAAQAELAALQGIIDYAENEAYSLESLKDSPEAVVEAERAWKAVEAARAAIAKANASGIAIADIDIDAILAKRREIALIWGIDDVLEIRPDLNVGQAWEVLETAKDGHDATCGITWETLESIAQDLFGDAPESDESVEE